MNERPTLKLKPALKTAAGKGASTFSTSRNTAAPARASSSAPRATTAVDRASGSVQAKPVARSESAWHVAAKPVLQPGYQTDLKPDSLAFCLLGAANAVAQVQGGTALPQALAIVFAQCGAAPQARGAIQDIAYRTMRQRGRSDILIGLMTSKAPEPPMLAGLLCCALSLMSSPDETGVPYEDFTVVDQAVTVANAHPDLAHAKGMVNAVLRRFLRERSELMARALQQPEAQWNYPQWWIDAARSAWPRNWEQILTVGNQTPPLTLRVNQRKTSVAAYLDLLLEAGIACAQVGPYAVRLEHAIGVALIPGFEDGLVSVQDAGAQLAAPLLNLESGMRVLDACAAPGGKSCHILELAQVNLTALDLDPKRLTRIGDNLARLGLSATLLAGDAQTRTWWDGKPFDRILADVPCTASGIVRRHPDIRWLRRKGDALQLAALSARIVDNLWHMLSPGGQFLFVTCSLWPQESEAQAAAFAVRNNALRLDAPGQLLPVSGALEDHDGLFYALFQKNAA